MFFCYPRRGGGDRERASGRERERDRDPAGSGDRRAAGEPDRRGLAPGEPRGERGCGDLERGRRSEGERRGRSEPAGEDGGSSRGDWGFSAGEPERGASSASGVGLLPSASFCGEAEASFSADASRGLGAGDAAGEGAGDGAGDPAGDSPSFVSDIVSIETTIDLPRAENSGQRRRLG